MLQTIHDKLKGIFAITILVALGIVFVFWGVDVSVGTFTKARGIEVNGREVPVQDVLRSYRDELTQYEAAFGAAGVPDDMRKMIQERALDRAIGAELIRQRTRKLRFAATDQHVFDQIRQIPAFQVGGEFSADAYHAALRQANLSAERFEAEQREFVLANQLDRGLLSSAFVLPAEFDRQLALRREARELAWFTVPANAFLGGVQLDDAAIQAYYDANKDRFMTEEQATVDYIEIDIATLAAGVAIDEAMLREHYEANIERFTTAGRRRARHILVEIGEDAAASEARARAAYERARTGEDFATLARELSADSGSRESGGDLGFAERGDFVAAFGDAVWGMSPGEIRGPIRSDFGWHVIKLEAVAPESVRSFDEVRAELEPELRRAEVEKAFGDRQEQLDTLAFEAAGDLAAVAEKMGLTIKRIERFTRSDNPLAGAKPQVTEAVFTADVLAGRELRTVELEPGRVIALGVVAHQPAEARRLDEIRDQITMAARLERAEQLAGERAASIAAGLVAGGDWDVAVRGSQAGVAVPTDQPRLVRRDDTQVPAEIKTPAFRAPAPQGKPKFGVAKLGTGDSAVWRVTAVRVGTLASLSPEEQQLEHDQARERVAMSDATVYVTVMRENADVDVNPQLFE